MLLMLMSRARHRVTVRRKKAERLPGGQVREYWGDVVYCDGIADACREAGHISPQTLRAWASRPQGMNPDCNVIVKFHGNIPETPKRKQRKPKKQVENRRCDCVLWKGFLAGALLVIFVLVIK